MKDIFKGKNDKLYVMKCSYSEHLKTSQNSRKQSNLKNGQKMWTEATQKKTEVN